MQQQGGPGFGYRGHHALYIPRTRADTPSYSFPVEDRESVRNCAAAVAAIGWRIGKNARWHAAWTFTDCNASDGKRWVGGLTTREGD